MLTYLWNGVSRLSRGFPLALILCLLAAPPAVRAAQPQGSLDSAGPTSASGWVCDADDVKLPVAVFLFATDLCPNPAQAGSCRREGTTDVCPFGGGTANVASTSKTVTDRCGGNKNHAFSLTLPATIQDGMRHKVYAYGVDPQDGKLYLLGSPRDLSATVQSTLWSQPNISGIAALRALVAPPPSTAPPQRITRLQLTGITSTSQMVANNGPIGNATGFTPSKPNDAQLAVANSLYAVQGEGNTIGFLHYPRTLASPRTGGLLNTMAIVYDDSSWIRPWANSPRNTLRFSGSATTPNATRVEGTAAYWAFVLKFHDCVDVNQQVYLNVSVFDAGRQGELREFVHRDTAEQTGLPILFTFLGRGATWVTPVPATASSSATTWTGWRDLGFSITGEQLRTALTGVSGRSNDPARYVLDEVNITHEVALDSNPSRAAGLGSAFRGLRLSFISSP